MLLCNVSVNEWCPSNNWLVFHKVTVSSYQIYIHKSTKVSFYKGYYLQILILIILGLYNFFIIFYLGGGLGWGWYSSLGAYIGVE